MDLPLLYFTFFRIVRYRQFITIYKAVSWIYAVLSHDRDEQGCVAWRALYSLSECDLVLPIIIITYNSLVICEFRTLDIKTHFR